VSLQASQQRRKILEYWLERTGNKAYSRKLSVQFKETVKYIADNNYLGRETSVPNVRSAICGNYLLFYRLTEDLEIISIFDSRRNPQESSIKG